MWTGNYFEIDIDFIRHGKTQSNIDRKYISYTDEPLISEGTDELQNKMAANYYTDADMVFSSPLNRARATAEMIYNKQVHIIDELVEINFGDFEGLTYEQLKDNPEYKSWLDSGGVAKIPNGESREVFVDRQDSALKKILVIAKDEKNCAVITHGGTVMALFDKYTENGYYDIMPDCGEKIGCHIVYEIKGNNDVSISHFSITHRDNP